ncbi:uncharacterized protein LOC6547949 [Drosophila erecta]|uniref:Uncharacterized protein, isoform A n=1 Tax=Drosophila erecta TaxID=7220 RepID=B3NQ78_DROER|nr:uncharacterized protein LOC6547949 [Drosophila erecta]XP_026836893.1 uncharacterized protein LOC6547949 [Drosophila erecta]XP_026836894.1 uncharacterized protein LOC6547949 [Drosophila erecta]XP_026836895.1 uncharacterized protein LOC6547949 [Drosophila erecta]EDV56951.1 uncharacterized protein Dere_GG22939, isoform A [Drosophila erecta]
MLRYLLILCALGSATCGDVELLTQTVYGFLDFTTTIGNTVMVFSPQSSPAFELKSNDTHEIVNIIETKPKVTKKEKEKVGIKPTPLIVTHSNVIPETETSQIESYNISLSNSPIQTLLNTPEYDLLSRQPEQFAEETYRLVNFKSKNEADRQRIYASKKEPVHGYQTRSSEFRSIVTATKDSGKFSKVSQVSQVHAVSSVEKKSKPRQTRTNKPVTPSIQPSRTLKEFSSQTQLSSKPPRKSHQSGRDNRGSSGTRKPSRPKGKRRNKHTQSSKPAVAPSATETTSRPSYRTKANANAVQEEPVSVVSPNAFKLNRRPGRWQYKSSPKPKVNIRKNANPNLPSPAQNDTAPSDEIPVDIITNQAINNGRDLEASGSQNGPVANNNNDDPNSKYFVQTLNVEISTPQPFIDTYYEIATIKTPFIFQAGVVKKTRFLTVTSTIEKVIQEEHTKEYSEDDGPLTENILEATASADDKTLTGSVTTLKPIYLGEETETPSLETLTESFSITHTKLKTQILPVVYAKRNETIQVTLVQTYDYTSLITVTQTISPLSDDFNPSKNFKDFEGSLDEAGSEINLDLEFGDEDNTGKFDAKIKPKLKVEAKSNVTSPLIPLIPESISFPETLQNSLITSTRPVIKLETIWESHVVPLVRGTETIMRTLSKSVGVVEKTEYVTEVATISMPTPSSQYPFSINPFNPFNPLLPIPPQQFITSTEVQQSMVTETSSKVLKLTFGARTAYTTIFSTSVVPTAVTRLITATIPGQPGQSFPNYYPPPYNPFAYVG